MRMNQNQTWVKGKRGKPVCLNSVSYRNGVTIVTAESDKLTEKQFIRALKTDWPETTFFYRMEEGYWIAEEF